MISGAKMTVGQFLQKLPKSVIKDGKVIDIRNSVGENLMVRERQREGQRYWSEKERSQMDRKIDTNKHRERITLMHK